jgi:uncharacterized membrane protein YcaP (DUF421 family)
MALLESEGEKSIELSKEMTKNTKQPLRLAKESPSPLPIEAEGERTTVYLEAHSKLSFLFFVSFKGDQIILNSS